MCGDIYQVLWKINFGNWRRQRMTLWLYDSIKEYIYKGASIKKKRDWSPIFSTEVEKGEVCLSCYTSPMYGSRGELGHKGGFLPWKLISFVEILNYTDDVTQKHEGIDSTRSINLVSKRWHCSRSCLTNLVDTWHLLANDHYWYGRIMSLIQTQVDTFFKFRLSSKTVFYCSNRI